MTDVQKSVTKLYLILVSRDTRISSLYVATRARDNPMTAESIVNT